MAIKNVSGQVAGLNIGIGIDTSKMQVGLNRGKSEVEAFARKIRRINLEGVIKGDPTSALSKSFQASRSKLSQMISSWITKVDRFDDEMDEAARHTAKSVEMMTNKFFRLKKVLDTYEKIPRMFGEKGKLGVFSAVTYPLDWMKDTKKITSMYGLPTSAIKAQVSKVGSMLKDLPSEKIGDLERVEDLDRLSGEARKAVASVRKEIELLNKMVKAQTGVTVRHVMKRWKMFGEELRKLWLQATQDERMAQIRAAQDVSQAIDRQMTKAHGLRVAEEQLRTEIREGIDTDRNKIKLIKNLADQRALNGKLTREQANLLKKLKYEEVSETNILKKRSKELEKIQLAETRMRREKKLGINVERNRIGLMNQLARRKELGYNLTKKQTKALKEFNREQERAARPQADQGFLSKAWFMQRARWFIQLRGFWAIWRGMAEAVRGAFEFEQEMANVKAIAQTTIKQFEMLRKKALEVGSTTRFSAKEAAEGMVVMSQAGLDSYEILDSIHNVAMLATATLYDFKKTAEIVTVVMRAWKISATESKRITDILATSINETRLNMDALATGFNYLSGVAPQLDISLEETTAMLGLMRNNGLSASTAATSLRAVLAAILKPTKRFKEQLEHVGLTLDDVNPRFYNIFTIFEKMREAGWSAAESFRAFRRRAASGATVLITNSQALSELSDNMYQLNRAQAMAIVNLDTASGQWKQYKDMTIKIADTVRNELEPTIRIIIKAIRGLTAVFGRFISFFAINIGRILEGWEMLVSVITTGSTEAVRSKKKMKEFLNLSSEVKSLKDEMNSLVNSFRKVRDARIKAFAFMDRGDERGGQSQVDLYERALKVLREAGILQADEVEKYLDLEDISSRRLEIENMINDNFDKRKRKAAAEYDKLKDILEVKEKILATEALQNLKPLIKGFKEAYEGYKSQAQFTAEQPTAFGEPYFNKIFSEKGAFEGVKGRVYWPFATGKAIKELNIKNYIDDLNKFVRDIQVYTGASTDKIFSMLMDKESEYYSKTLDSILTAITMKRPEETIIEAYEKVISGEYDRTAEATKKMIEDFDEAVGKGAPVPDMFKQKEYDRLERLKIQHRKTVRNLEVEIANITDERSAKEKKIEKVLATYKNHMDKYKEISGATEQYEKLRVKHLEAIKEHYKDISEREAKDLEHKLQSLKTIDKFDKERLENAYNFNKSVEELIRKRGEEGRLNKQDMEIYRLMIDIDHERSKIIDRNEANAEKKLATDKAILELEERRSEIERTYGPKREKLLAIDYKILENRIKLLKTLDQDLMSEYERHEINKEISQRLREQRDLKEEQRRAADPIYDAWCRIRDKVSDVNQLYSDMITKFVEEFGSGLGDAFTDLTGGFQKQQQEVVDLKAELRELEHEYQEALSEGNQERAKELAEHMAKVRHEIEDLEDPIHNLGEAFKSFFKEVIDGIRDVIVKWLVMQAIMKIGSMFFGGGIPTERTAGGTGYDPFNWTSGATGGVLPSIKSFRALSRGGLTSNPTVALLGDNPSKTELVIPSENIERDKVSGYTRSKEDIPINIVNVITEQDFASTMSKPMGGRVIVNRVLQDIDESGPIARKLQVA